MKKPKKSVKKLPVPMAPKPPLLIPTAQQLAAAAPPSQLTIRQLSDLAVRQVALEDEIAGIEAKLKEKNDLLRVLSMSIIPSACDEAGVKAITLPDGTKIEVAEILAASITEENRPAAFRWLRANKAGAIIKNEFKVILGKGQDKIAKAVIAAMTKIAKQNKLTKIPVERKESVNWQTLQAFVKEKLQAGQALPPEINVTKVPTAKVIRPKEM